MTVIDVDTHFEPGRGWLDDRPDLAARLPEYSVADATMRAQVGELLAFVPEDQRPPRADLLPPKLAAILGEIEVEGYGFAGSAMHSPCDPDARLAWMDENGIDVANVLCLEGAGYARTLDDRELFTLAGYRKMHLAGLVPSLVLVWMQVSVLAAIGVALSTRFSLVVNLPAVILIYIAGNLTRFLYPIDRDSNVLTKGLAAVVSTVLPYLAVFDQRD